MLGGFLVSDEVEFEDLNLPTYDVITIILDGGSPRIDLGDVEPLYAMALFQQIADELKFMIPDPAISSRGSEMFAVFSLFDDDDDEDDD